MYCLIRKEKIQSKQQLEHNEFGIEIMFQELKLFDLVLPYMHSVHVGLESYMHRKKLHAPVHVCTLVNRALALALDCYACCTHCQPGALDASKSQSMWNIFCHALLAKK